MQKEQNPMLFKITLKISMYDYTNLKKYEEYKYVYSKSIEDLKDEMMDMVESVSGSIFDLEIDDVVNYLTGQKRDILSYELTAERLDNVAKPGERLVKTNINDIEDSVIIEIYEGSLITTENDLLIDITKCALVIHHGSDEIDPTPVTYDGNRLYYD